MIRPSSQMHMETRLEMRGGKGEVRIQHLFAQGEFRGHTRLMAKVTLGPGCSIGLHEHAQEEELFYILTGRGRVTEDAEIREVGPGDAILTGGGGSHAIENIGDGDLELLAVILTY